VVVCVQDISILTIFSRIILSGWLLWLMGCFIWVFRRYSMFRQSVNMWAGSFWYVVVRSCRVWCMAIISARKIFCSPGNFFLFLGV
jgi:hypothetical protein